MVAKILPDKNRYCRFSHSIARHLQTRSSMLAFPPCWILLSDSDIFRTRASLLRLPDYLIHRLGDIFHIPGIRARHADPPVLRHINMRILPDLQHLLLRQAREAEHADLIRDVLPAALLPVQLLQFPSQGFAHVDDAAGHGAQVGFPFFEELGVVEDEAGDAGAVGGRVADLAALEDGELGCYATDCALGVRAGAGDEVEGAGSFAVETEVLGEGLGDAQFEALLDEVSDSPGVIF